MPRGGKHITSYNELEDGMKFVGRIVEASWEESKYGEQLHLQIEPLDHEIQGKTGMYHAWYSYTTRKQSKYGEFLNRLEALGFADLSDDFSEIIGKDMEWERCDIKVGNMVATDVLLPAVDGVSTDVVEQTKPKSVTPALSDDLAGELEQKLREMGMTKSQIDRWRRLKGITTTELNAHMEMLSDSGKLEVSDDGTYFLND